MVSACGPTIIGGAMSPGGNGGYQVLMAAARPMLPDAHGPLPTSVASAACAEQQQRRMSAGQHQMPSPGAASGHGVCAKIIQ
jgi:hypothetical protein